MSFILNPYRYSVTFPHYAACDGSNADLYDPNNIQSAGTFTVPSDWNGRKVRATGAHWSNSGTATQSMAKGGSNFDGAGALTYANSSASTADEDGGSIHSAPIVVSTGDTFTFTNCDNYKCVEVLPASVKSALVNRITSSFSVGSALTTVDWNNEVYDTDSWHDNSTNPSRLTVPSGVTMIRLTGSIEVAASGGELGIQLFKNGSAFTTNMEYDQAGTSNKINFMSPPIPCTTGDYFEVKVRSTSATSVSVSNNSWFAIEELNSSVKYAIGRRSSNTTVVNGGNPLNVAMDTEDTDVGGWFTAGGTKFTVPSGVTRIRCGFFTKKTNAVGSFNSFISKNNSGSAADGLAACATNNAGEDCVHAVSSILEVTAGDTFDFYGTTDAGAQNMLTGSFFWIEEVAAITS